MSEHLHLTTFSEIAERYIKSMSYTPYYCDSEEEAREKTNYLISKKKWPCYFFESNTTGEKDFEEFYTENEKLEMERFESIGVICNEAQFDEIRLDKFIRSIDELRVIKDWRKDDILKLYYELLPDFAHKETGRYLDQRM